MANLYTKTGDGGTTALVGGKRVSKTSLRVESYGTVDELCSMLGCAYVQARDEYVRSSVHAIQKRLFALGAELASDEDTASTLKDRISDDDVSWLEGVVDTCTETVGKQTAFVVPGVDEASAALHVARTIARRAERRTVALAQEDCVRDVLARYLNRLSDALYALARFQEELHKRGELRERVAHIVEERLADGTAGDLPPFSLDVLREMAERARRRSREIGVPIVFSAVDCGGNLVLLERMEGALLGSVDISIGKAYTAVAFRMPTSELGRESTPQGPLFGVENSAPGKIVLFGGGFPYIVNGAVVGGVGVSGGTVEQDMDIARYAMAF